MSGHVAGYFMWQESRVHLPFGGTHRLDEGLAVLMEPVQEFLALLEPVRGIDGPVSGLDVPVGRGVGPWPALEPEAGRIDEVATGPTRAAEPVDRLPVERFQTFIGDRNKATGIVGVPPVAVGLNPVATLEIQAARHVGRGGRGCCPLRDSCGRC